MIRFFVILSVCFFLTISSSAQSPQPPLLIGRVAINQSHIAFTYGGKIWLVERSGGTAKRLTTTPNEENAPVFSPDGQRIAFSRSNGNDWDVYVTLASGGEARRVTMMPEDDGVVSWTPDGKEVIFETTRDEENVTRLYRISVDREMLATPLPLPQASQGSLSPDGTRIAYNPRGGAGEWRYYRGGFAAPIWIADVKTGALEKLSTGTHNDRSPIWKEDKIYFTSDRSGIYNLYVYDTKSRQTKQLTRFADQGVRTASVFGDTAAYVQGGRIHLFNLMPGGADQVVNISVSPDTSELAPRNANAMRFLEQILPSATGDKIVFGARGDVLLFDPATGAYKNLTNTTGIAERYPVISPDNKSVAYVSDESGEYALHIRSLENDAVQKIEIEKQPSFYWGLVWSPDSKKLAFPDRRLNLWLADVAKGTAVKVGSSPYSSQDSWTPNFSPDSRFLTYSMRLHNRAGAVFIYDIEQMKNVQATDGVTHAQMPVFDPNGKYLYFISSMNAGTSEFGWGVINSAFANPLVVRRVHAVVLSKDEISPLLASGQPNPDAKIAEIAPAVKIDFDALQSRVVNLPLPLRDYSQLAVGKPGKLILAIGEWSAAPGDFSGQSQAQAVYSFDLSKAAPMEKIVDKIDAVDITPDGNRILYRKSRDYFLAGTGAAVQPGEGKQDFNKMEVRVNPAEEWKQMFHESMRIMRDWFYDPNYHGQNLTQLERDYAAYLPAITRRSDLNRLMQQMLGNVSVSHLGVGGGDAAPPTGGGNRIGLLGADYEIADGKYRFKKIYRSTSFASPAGAFNAPLGQPGIDVREGDYLLEVNGQAVDAAKNILTYFENTVGQPTKITVSANSTGTPARTFTIYPAGGENRLRRANWAEDNRKLVDKLSGGKLGYIFVENYGFEGIMNAIRGLSGYADKNGVIIDQRFNGGGITPDYLIEWMQRKPLYYYMFRGGDDIATPVNPAPPVKVMIINELNGSAAETGAFMFKLGKVGSLVGKRTFGGGIGPYYFTPTLIDGGRVQLPNRAAYNPDGSSWGIENIGVPPDFDVEITPQDLIAGRDPQLEKAVEVALAQSAKNPIISPKRPAYPIHPIDPARVASTGLFTIPEAGSAFPAPQPKASATPAPKVITSGKFGEFVGNYDAGSMGILAVTQEGDKLFATAPNGERMELVPGSVADKFVAQPIGAATKFNRDAAGKVVSIVVTLPNGREIQGNKTP